MNARDIFELETGRQAYDRHGPCNSYIEWLERIVEQTAAMVEVTKSRKSIYDHDDVQELMDIFKKGW